MKKSIHPGTAILIGFGAMVCFMIYLVYQCNQNPVVMVSKNYYDQEITYQQQIDARNNMQQVGEKVLLEKQGNQLAMHIPQRINANLKTMDVSFHHSANANLDKQFHPSQTADGNYRLPIDKDMRGSYKVEVKMTGADKNYEEQLEIKL